MLYEHVGVHTHQVSLFRGSSRFQAWTIEKKKKVKNEKSDDLFFIFYIEKQIVAALFSSFAGINLNSLETAVDVFIFHEYVHELANFANPCYQNHL